MVDAPAPGRIGKGTLKMADNIGGWLDGDEWARVEGEVRQFLDTWSFFVAESGLIYARPTIRSLRPRHVFAFLRRLRIICDDAFPSIIVMDFGGAAIQDRHRVRMARDLDRFAWTIEARHVHRPSEGSSYSLIYRPRRLGWTIPGFCLPFSEFDRSGPGGDLEAISRNYAELLADVRSAESRLMGGLALS